MKIGKKALRVYIGMFTICLFSFTTGLHNTLFGGLNNAIMFLLLGLLLVWNRKLNFLNDKLSIASFVLIFVMLFNNQDNKHLGTFFVYGTLAYCLGWLFFVLNKKENHWHKAFLYLCFGFGLMHSILTWIFKLLPGLYTSAVIPLLGQWGSTALKEFQNGWAPGLSPTYSTNAVYIAFGFITAISLFIVERKRKHIFSVIVCISALLLTGKRSQLIASVFSFFLMYYFYNSDKRKTRIFKIIGIALMSVLIFDVASNYIPELSNFINRFHQTAAMGDISLGRNARFVEAWLVFLNNPLFGIGWNGSSYFFASTTAGFINVHNIYIQLLCETGILGAALYFSFFIYNFVIAYKLTKIIKKRSGYQKQKILIISSFMIQVFFLIYGLTGNSLYDFQTLFPYLAACAITLYYSKLYSSMSLMGDKL